MFRQKFYRVLFLLIPALPCSAFSQNTAPDWVSYYQGLGDNSDRYNKVVSDGSGNFVATGYTLRSGNYKDVLTVKLDANGDTLWTHTKNGKNGGDDEGVSLAIDASGNIYVAAYGDWGTTNNDILVIKYDQNGTKLWDTTWNSPASFDDVPVAIGLDAAGNVYVGGNAEPDTVSGSSDYVTLKFDPNGTLLWSQQYSRNGVTAGKDEMAGMVVDASGNVFVTGRSSNGNDDDFVTLKYDASGAQQFLQIYNSGNGDDRATAITFDNAGNIIVTGRNDNGNNDDFRTIKYSAAGVLQWSKAYNAPANQNDRALAVTVDASDNVYVTGQTDVDNTTVTNYDFGTVKYNSAGTQQWARITGSPFNQYDIPSAIVTDAAGNVYVTGKSDQDVTTAEDNDWMTVMYNTGGTLQWTLNHAGTKTGGGDIPYSAIIDGGSLYVVGGTDNTTTQKDATIVKYDIIGSETFAKYYNGQGDFNDDAKAVEVGANDNSYTAGYSFVEGNNRDASIIKQDATGAFQCSYFYQGIKGDDDEFNDIALSLSGSLYAVGYTKVSGQKSNILLVKVDPTTCTAQWSYTYDYIGQSDKGVGVVLDALGNAYITGYSDENVADSADNNDIVTIKVDAAGNELWVQRYNGTGNLRDEPSRILLDNNGNVLVCGRTENVHDDDFVLLRYDGSTGNPVWATPFTYGGPFTNDDRALDMTIDSGNNTYVCGYSQTASGSATEDPVIVKVDVSGTFAGFYSYSGIGADEAISIGHDVNDNIFATFRADADPSALTSNYDILTMKFDNGLNPLWATPPQYDSPIQQDDKPVKLLVTTAGILVCGTTENDTVAGRVNQNVITLMYDTDGQQLMFSNFDGPNATDDAPNAMAVHGNYLWVAGYAEGTNNNQKDNLVLQYGLTVGINETGNTFASAVYPNPAVNTVHFSTGLNDNSEKALTITDITGKVVKQFAFSGNELIVDLGSLSTGLYQYEIKNHTGSSRGKFVIN